MRAPARSSSSLACSKPTVNVGNPGRIVAARVTTSDESRPLDKKVPTGTSAIRRSAIASSRRCANRRRAAARQAIERPLVERGGEHFGVGCRGEAMALGDELVAQRAEIVDLAVEDERDAAARRGNRLRAADEIDDGETAMAEDRAVDGGD